MMSEITENGLNDIREILEDIGTYIEDISPETKLEEVILDSMSLISFYVEIEERFNVFLPEDIYSKKLSEYTISMFWNDINSAKVQE